MPPIVAIHSFQWAGFHKLRSYSALQSSREPKPTLQIASTADKILHPRVNSQDGDPTHGPPVISNPETTMGLPDSHKSPIPGLSRSLFIVVIISGVVVLALAVFIPAYCWRRRKRNRQRKSGRSREADLELAGLEDGSPDPIYDTPRPDSTTLPIQGILMQAPTKVLPVMEGAMESSLGDMLNRFSNGSGSALHRRLESEDSGGSRITWGNDVGIWSEHLNYQDRSRSRSPLGPVSPPLALLRSPTIASFNSNPVGTLRSPTITSFNSNSRAALQSPTVTSFASSSPRLPAIAKGKKPARNSKPTSKASSTKSNKLRKRTRRKCEKTPAPKPVASSAISVFAGFGRASAGSMSNWTSWWDSSSDEEGDAVVKERKQRT